MSTFNIPGTDPAVPVSLTSNITKEQLLEFPAFKVRSNAAPLSTLKFWRYICQLGLV